MQPKGSTEIESQSATEESEEVSESEPPESLEEFESDLQKDEPPFLSNSYLSVALPPRVLSQEERSQSPFFNIS